MPSFVHLIDQRRLIGPGGSTVSGSIYFYYTNTSILAPVYQDVGQTIPAPNPVEVGAGEVVPILFLDTDIIYRRVIEYSDGSVDEQDPLGSLFSEGELGLPVGAIVDFAGPVAPTGFLLCYGQEVSREEYADLFAAIGVTYGAGNGSTTFNLPDSRGRVSAGKDNMGGVASNRLQTPFNGSILGGAGGSAIHTLSQAELPSHTHTVNDPGHFHAYTGPTTAGTGIATGANLSQIGTNTGPTTTGITVTGGGSNQPHNNVQPTIVYNKIIKATANTFLSLIELFPSFDQKANALAIGIDPDDSDMGAAEVAIYSNNGTVKEWFKEAGQSILAVQAEVTPWITPQMFPGDTTTQFENALAYLGSQGGGVLRVPAGLYNILRELKIPSNVTIFGDGIHKTIIRGADTMPLADNVLTNSENNRLARTTYNDNIHIMDLTVDGNWQVRAPTTSGSTQGQATCIKYSTVRNSSVRRVRAINGILHCIDIMASVYWDDGDPTSQPPGPSLNCWIEDCIAENSSRDDGITTHNSGYIQINRCQALFDETLYSVGENQQGIEADEGSYNISIEDCYVRGWAKGYQVKGHSTTRPAISVHLLRCIAENCAMSFEVAHTTGSIGRDVTIRDCISRNVVAKHTYAATALNLKNYSDILVDNFTVEGNSPDIAIRISDPTPNIRLRNITFKDGTSLTGDTSGLIHAYASVGSGIVVIENVVCETAIGCPVIRFSATGTIKRVRDISATGTSALVACVWMARNVNDEVRDIRQTGFLCDIWSSGDSMGFSNYVEIGRGNQILMRGSGSPEGVISAPNAAQWFRYDGGGKPYIKASSPTASTGWVVVGTQT